MNTIETIAPVESWHAPEEEYNKGNRNWLPCTEEFYWEMLECMPPIYQGRCFGVIEAWKDGKDGQPVHLWFRSRPFSCRCASRQEIMEEQKQ